MNTRSKRWLGVVVMLAAAGAARAEVRLPKIFTDHMVLQQELPICVWGWADAGKAVSVSFNSQTVQTKAGHDGKWRVKLPAMKADGKAHTLTVKGGPSTGSGQVNTIQLKDVLLGEVWLGSGQSNMGRPVGGKAIEQANYPRIRLFHVEGKAPRRGDLHGTFGWLICTPQALKTSGDGLKADDGKALNWFEISDGTRKDKRPTSLYRYVKAQAKIVSKDTVEVRAPQVKNPKFGLTHNLGGVPPRNVVSINIVGR